MRVRTRAHRSPFFPTGLICFDLGGFTPLGLLEDVFVVWFGWMVIITHELGENV